ncbi:MAG: hypothetical protein B7Y99_08380 [Caulobacterales bacterium 32-69-10]|nr:MAG: hypothetical protein B7Y99_08380 [Caulobacterales bacterium 32-69-10]
MSRPGETAGEAVSSAFAFAQDAARRLWGVQALAAFGVAVVFAALRGRMSASEAADLWRVGWWTILVSAAPLWAGLYRLELGGKALRTLGPAGLQFGLAEIRLIVLAAAFVAASAFVWLPVVAVSALIFVLFRFAGAATLAHVGEVQVSFLIVLALWLGVLGVFAWICARCAFAPAATVGKRRLVLREAWDLGRGRTLAVLGGWLLVQAPTVLVVVLLALLDEVARHDPMWGARGRWPLADAAVGGLVLGLVMAFVQAPLTVGVLGYLYRARRERYRALSAVTPRRFRPELLAG